MAMVVAGAAVSGAVGYRFTRLEPNTSTPNTAPSANMYDIALTG